MRWPASWGWPGLVALLALLAAAVLGGVLAPQWRAQADAARHARQRQPAPAHAPAPVAAPRRALPAAGDGAARVAALLRLGPRHGVTVERAQQQLSRSGGVQRLQVVLAAKGGYGALRAFVADALQADPGLSLDQVHLRRSSAETDTLDADLMWSVHQPVPGAQVT